MLRAILPLTVLSALATNNGFPLSAGGAGAPASSRTRVSKFGAGEPGAADG